MKQRYKWLLAGVSTVAVLTIIGVAGCATKGSQKPTDGTTPSLTNQTTTNTTGSTPTTGLSATNSTSQSITTSSTQTTQSLSSFPNIVNMAMKNFPANVLNGAEAPTVLPISNSGSNELYYRTWDTTTGPILSYGVQFSSPHNMLATFMGSIFSGLSASDSVRLPYAQGHVTSSNVHLSDGIVAKEHVFVSSSAKETSSDSLTWNEGRWQIEVTRTQDTKEPIAEADAVAAYLHTHSMPVPQTKGTIYVNVYPGENAQGQLSGTSVSENIKWQKGSHVYEVDTYSDVKNPIQTGLAMAISMKPYTQ